MKLVLQKEDLKKTLKKICDIPNKTSTLPILSYCAFTATKNNLEIYNTNLEVGISKSMECESAEEGCVLLPPKKLYDIVKTMTEDTITLFTENENNLSVVVESEGIKFKFLTMPFADYPKPPVIPDIKSKYFVTTPAKTLSTALKQVTSAIDTNETRVALGGAHIKISDNKMCLVGSNGHKLNITTIDVVSDIDKKVIVPKRALRLIQEIEDKEIKLYLGDNNYLYVESEQPSNTKLYINLINGQYPDYKALIKEENAFVINVQKDKLLESVKRVKIMSNENTNALKLLVTDNNIKLCSESPEIGEASENIDAEYNGNNLAININADYLLDVLNVFAGDEVNITLGEESDRCYFRDKTDKEFTGIIMLLRF